ncbi:hypothetical protein OIC43_27420 [Streptomyces sp. NBC_00825]|uniref:hypothetical protein n=1 Tax=unclassified Streptomyces TaxID=2593676 RepID=UPI002ED5F7BA|nr:hypothetical protein OG832_16260 [Streptomyces sp. NBC_00826]WTH92497.1 hypothetical protein OIC43_27420 [Streptomyces sp. NBC_00825]WTI01228.1 hypothetical protein OHA23_27400 [Streptomyces sp. NBC_00822]
MLKYEDLIDAPVAKLKTAVDDWDKMASDLDKLADDAAKGMKVKSDKAEWEGLNAGVTKAFVTKTAKEFADAAAEAKGVKAILEEGHAAIKKAKDELIDIRDHEGPAAGIKVDDKGTVAARHPVSKSKAAGHDPDYPAMLQRERANIESWQKRIDLIVDNCNDTDVSFKNSLEANVTDRKDFTAPKYTKMDQEEADRAARLAAKGRDITHTELQALNELLHDNSNSSEFAKDFYRKLTPEKSLAFFGQLSTDTYEYGKVDKERLKDVQALQKNLGLNLAMASRDKDFSAEWGPELRKLGTERIPLTKYDSGGPFGYQLLGGIMRYGNYDAKFLNPIAEHVAQLHQKDPDMFAGNKVVNSPFKNPFNPSGVNGSGYDPTVSMLEALGNSPDAAKHFFHDTPTAYNEDGTVNKDAAADLGKDKDRNKIENYLDFFGVEKWDSYGDVDSLDEKELKASLNYMPDALGHALEAATLGYPAGHPDASIVRDGDNAEIMRDVMVKYSDANLLKVQESLSDSLGAMGAGYIDDINWAMDENKKGSVFEPGGNGEGHLDFSDPIGPEGRETARKFLGALGHHPDAYASLSAAEQVYTSSALEAQVGKDGEIDTGDVRRTVKIGAEVQGMLDQSRADQVEDDGVKAHEEYEKAAEKRSGWTEFGGTAALGAGVATAAYFLPAAPVIGAGALLVPLFTDVGTGAVEQVIGDLVGGMGEDAIDKNKEKVDDLTAEQRAAIYTAGENYTEAPVDNFVARHKEEIDRLDARTGGSLAEDLDDSRLLGYGDGNLRARVQGVGPAS